MSAMYRQKYNNCSFCGASAHLFPVVVIGNLKDALR